MAFDAPDAQTRRKIWTQLWPETLGTAGDVDLDVVARDFEISGGHIKEVILRAASLALAESGGVVTRQQLMRCVNMEYKKMGKLSVVARRS